MTSMNRELNDLVGRSLRRSRLTSPSCVVEVTTLFLKYRSTSVQLKWPSGTESARPPSTPENARVLPARSERNSRSGGAYWNLRRIRMS